MYSPYKQIFARGFCSFLIISLVTLSCNVLAQNTGVYIKNSFIEEYKNKALITSQIKIIDISSKHSIGTKASDDGDVHASGIPEGEYRLPMVVEIMNVKKTPAAYNALKDASEDDATISVTGVWRLWCEHPGHIQKQGDAFSIDPDDSNPDHVFEIHPATSVDNVDCKNTLTRIKDGSKEFKYKVAEDAFDAITNSTFTITPQGDYVGLKGKKIGYNYIKFKAELLESPLKNDGSYTHSLDDNEGYTAFASITDGDGEEHKVRLVFVEGTAVANTIKSKNEGQTVTLLGIPRINLSLVSWRINNPGPNDEHLNWNLPFELVVLASF